MTLEFLKRALEDLAHCPPLHQMRQHFHLILSTDWQVLTRCTTRILVLIRMLINWSQDKFWANGCVEILVPILNIHRSGFCKFWGNIRGRSDKYFASALECATIAREIYYCVVHSRRRLLQNFSRIGLVVLFWPRVETDVSAHFTKMEKEQYRSVILFLFLEGKSRGEIKERLEAAHGDSSL